MLNAVFKRGISVDIVADSNGVIFYREELFE